MSKIQQLIGQQAAKQIMEREAWHLREHPEEVPESFCFIGPPSVGKTISARALAADAGIPILELQPQAIRKADDLMNAIDGFGFTQAEAMEYQRTGKTPRLVIFIDEVHQISNAIEQALLKALEPNDRLLVSEDGRKVDTSRFVFMFATTDRGDLFDALDTRTVKISLQMYSQDEIAQIVKLNYPAWNVEACKLVAMYNPTFPREALAFARAVSKESKRTGNNNAQQVARTIAKQFHIDEFGMTQQRLSILTVLGQAPIARSRIRHVANVKDSELQKFVLPPLLCSTPDREMPLVTVSNKGYTITPAGLAELDKRNIPNRGSEAIPKAVRMLFPDSEEEQVEETGTVKFREFTRKA